ncbi:MAG: lysophospholipase [Polyangiaceae bacterium]|nr:lysophospholipase [Polyangiaceae bacterium]
MTAGVRARRTLVRPGAPELYYTLDTPVIAPVAGVFLVHGYGDHRGRYDHAVDAWCRAGLAVGSLDLRGHGRSGGVRGAIRSFADYLDDVGAVLDALATEPTWAALGAPVLIGHSMGALVTAHFALRAPARCRALVWTSPFFALSLPVPAYKRVFARLLSGIAPDFTLPSRIPAEALTHDQEMVERNRADSLLSRVATARWFVEVANAQRSLLGRAPALGLPVRCWAAGDDRIADLEVTRRACALMPRAELVVHPDRYHELMHEIDAAAHVAAVAVWVQEISRASA